MRKNRLRLLLSVFFLTAGSVPAFAQGTATSSIIGVVVDKTGGGVPGATVQIKNEGTSAEFSAVTASDGAFTVPSVSVGNYTVTVSLQGSRRPCSRAST